MEFNLFGITINEPDVALTDYALAIECIVLAILLFRMKNKNPGLKHISVLFFASLALGSLLGGTVHGFFPDKLSSDRMIMWKLTLVAIGITTFFLWAIATFLISRKYRKLIIYFASLGFVFYVWYVFFENSDFKVAIVNYFIASIFLLTLFLLIYLKQKAKPLILGIVGILLTFIGGWVQQSKFSVSNYFNHNALYHLIQAVALILIFFTLRFLIETRQEFN